MKLSLLEVLIIVVVVVLIAVIIIGGSGSQPQQTKNRVPAMQQRGYPPKDEPTSTGIPDKRPEELHPAPVAPAAPVKQESPKEGRSEHTGMGVITEVSVTRQDTPGSDGFFLGFTLQEDGGFQKRFYPVCDGQTLPTGKPVAIMYHWRRWGNAVRSQIGCYVIDGYQLK